MTVALAVLIAGAVFVWTQVLVHKERDVAVPPDDAPPAAVVRAYLDALDAHDCETAAATWAPEPDFDVEESCRGTASVTDIEVSEPLPGPDAVTTNVDVHFDIQPRWWSQDKSMVGPTTWAYDLRRDTSDAPWRIVGGGMG